ncbi:hypothetical protein, partial [Nocardia brasiliensis]|uniref:hypothetical protein n=1 Tax=Nocardia brasiliensis TaxID=37326 RepID=UPI002455F36E
PAASPGVGAIVRGVGGVPRRAGALRARAGRLPPAGGGRRRDVHRARLAGAIGAFAAAVDRPAREATS